jgi:hypothetical protein
MMPHECGQECITKQQCGVEVCESHSEIPRSLNRQQLGKRFCGPRSTPFKLMATLLVLTGTTSKLKQRRAVENSKCLAFLATTFAPLAPRQRNKLSTVPSLRKDLQNEWHAVRLRVSDNEYVTEVCFRCNTWRTFSC